MPQMRDELRFGELLREALRSRQEKNSRYSLRAFAAFLEVDLGNEGLSVWKRKVESYLQYAISGEFEKQFGQLQFRVLVIANTTRRMRSLQTATISLTDKIFWFSTFEFIAQTGFWSPVWLRAKDGERQRLL